MANITDEELTEEFESFSVSIDSSDLMDKLKRICQMYRLDVEKIVEEWIAFCSTKKLPSKKLSLDGLDQLERERLNKSTSRISSSSYRGTKTGFTTSTTRMFDADTIDELVNANAGSDMLDAYTTPNGKVMPKKRQHTPEISASKRLVNVGRSPGLSQSPHSQQSPNTNFTPSQRYATRTNAREVLCSFGNSTLRNDRRPNDKPISVKHFSDAAALRTPYKFMFQKTADKAYVLDDLIIDIGEQLKAKLNMTEEYAHVALPVQDTVTVVGRICCDSNGKLNASSLLLEGAIDTSAGRQVSLDVSAVPQYSIFPGQIVAVEGTNNSGKRFNATKIHEGISPAPADVPTLENGGFSVVVAAGPFTTTDNILNEPFGDLVVYLEKGTPPDVCIVFGPFVDAKHPLLEKGDVDIAYEDLFGQLLKSLIATCARLKMHLVVVPSNRDLHHDFVYPQPPYKIPYKLDLPNNIMNYIHFVSDPCTLDIDGVIIGLTSTDVLFHLGAEEISTAQTSDRISRLIQHILSQNTYYPLYPPHVDVPLDLEHFDTYCRLPVQPHLLILPSDLRCFVKEVGQTVCVNPGRMAKGQVGGTFSRLYIHPVQHTSSDENDNFVHCVDAEIIRI